MPKMLPFTIGAAILFVLVLIAALSYLLLRPADAPVPTQPLTTDMIVHGVENEPVHPGGEIVIEATRCNLAREPIVVDVLATYERVNQVSEKVTLVAADDSTLQPGCASSNTRWSLPAQVGVGLWRINVEYTEEGQEIATATSNDFVVDGQ